MTTRTALFTLLALWGVGACPPAAFAQEAAAAVEAVEANPVKRSLANRVWVKTDTGDLPSVIRVFLSDGTLISDSCWETHRLSPWHMTSDTALSWNEDGVDIAADIVSVSATQLVLNLALMGGERLEERYTAADVPYVCPDMPR